MAAELLEGGPGPVGCCCSVVGQLRFVLAVVCHLVAGLSMYWHPFATLDLLVAHRPLVSSFSMMIDSDDDGDGIVVGDDVAGVDSAVCFDDDIDLVLLFRRCHLCSFDDCIVVAVGFDDGGNCCCFGGDTVDFADVDFPMLKTMMHLFDESEHQSHPTMEIRVGIGDFDKAAVLNFCPRCHHQNCSDDRDPLLPMTMLLLNCYLVLNVKKNVRLRYAFRLTMIYY